MLLPNDVLENTPREFLSAIDQLHLARLLRKSNIRKACGVPIMEVFQFLLLLVFHGKNLWRFLQSKHAENVGACKNTFYRLMENPSFNWVRFLTLLFSSIIAALQSLTKSSRHKVLILDDSAYSRNTSKKVELLAKFFDHVSHRYLRGFTMLTLGWSDGFSFIPVGFNLLSSAKKSNRYQDMADVDHHTSGPRQHTVKARGCTEAHYKCTGCWYPCRLHPYGYLVYHRAVYQKNL